MTPPEPPMGWAVVEDRGHEWRRDDDGWYCLCTNMGEFRWEWADVVDDIGDLRQTTFVRLNSPSEP